MPYHLAIAQFSDKMYYIAFYFKMQVLFEIFFIFLFSLFCLRRIPPHYGGQGSSCRQMNQLPCPAILGIYHNGNSMPASNSGSLTAALPCGRRNRLAPAKFPARLLLPRPLLRVPRSCLLRPQCAFGEQ